MFTHRESPVEKRFERVWETIVQRRQAGEKLPAILEDCTTAELIAALASAGRDDEKAANVIATHLLNRQRRGPFLGASVVSFATLVAVYVSDFLLFGSPFQLAGGPISQMLAVFSLIVALFSLSTFAMWRGYFPRVRMLFHRDRAF